MNRYAHILLGPLSLLFFAQTAVAGSCDDPINLTGDISYAIVRDGVEQLHFIAPQSAERPNCPSLDAACKLTSFVVPGDQVLITGFLGNSLACTRYISPDGKMTSGVLDTSALGNTNVFELLDTPNIVGEWRRDNTASIEIQRYDGLFLVIHGEAALPPPSTRTGTIEGPAFIGGVGDVAGYSTRHYAGDKLPTAASEANDDACNVRFRSTGYYLLVDDNDRCGGQGVSFTGVYVKAKTPGK